MAEAQDEMIMTTVLLPESLYNRIKKLADDEERSMAYFVRKATEKFLDEREGEKAREPQKKGK